MDDRPGQTGQWTAPSPVDIAIAAAKYGAIPVPAICHKCGSLVISGVCIITIFDGLICPVCCRAVEEERELNGIAQLERMKRAELDANRRIEK